MGPSNGDKSAENVAIQAQNNMMTRRALLTAIEMPRLQYIGAFVVSKLSISIFFLSL